MWSSNSNTCCSHTKDLQASIFQVNTVEASISQKMRISYLAAAVLMVYLSFENNNIVEVYICEATIKTRVVQTLKTYRPHSFWCIQWRPEVQTLKTYRPHSFWCILSLRIDHLAEAVLMVYLTCDCTTIFSSLHMWCWNSNTCCSHTKNLQASFFPVNTVEASVSQKMRISHLAAAVLMLCSTVIIALLCEFTYVMLLFKHVLFKHKRLTGLILSGEYSGCLCLSKLE